MATITLTNNNNTFTMIYNYNESTNKFSITDSYITINKANSDNCMWTSSYRVFFDALIKIKKWNKNGYVDTTTLLQCTYVYKNGAYTNDSGVVTWGGLGFTGTSDTPRKIQLHKILKDASETIVETINNFSNSSGKSTWNYTFTNSSSNLINIDISISMRGSTEAGGWSGQFFTVKDNRFLILPESSGTILYSDTKDIPQVITPEDGQIYNINSKFKLVFCAYNIDASAKTAKLYVCPILRQTSDGLTGVLTSFYSSGVTPKLYIKDVNNNNNQIKFIFSDNTWLLNQAYTEGSQYDGYSIDISKVWSPMYAGNTSYMTQGNYHIDPNNFIATVKLNSAGQISIKYGFNFKMFMQVTNDQRGYADISNTSESQIITSTDINIEVPYDGSFAKAGDSIEALNSGTADNGAAYSNLKNYETLRQYVYAFTNDSNLSTAITIESEGSKITYTNLIKPLNKIRTLLNSGNYTIPTSVLSTTKQNTIKNTTFSQGSTIVALKDYFTVINYLSSHY